MKLSLLSKKEKLARKRKKEMEWHLVFAWLPVRIDNDTVVWFERYARKDTYSRVQYDRTLDIYTNPVWTYKLAEDLVVDKLKGKK